MLTLHYLCKIILRKLYLVWVDLGQVVLLDHEDLLTLLVYIDLKVVTHDAPSYTIIVAVIIIVHRLLA